MKKTTVYHTRHCSYKLHVRLVFVTTYRRKVFTARIINELKTIFETVCLQFNAGLIEFEGKEDHVHLLILDLPQLSISELVFRLKGTSSMLIRKRKYPAVRTKLWGKALWSSSYFASSCGGAPISIIRQYIEQQKTPD